MKELEDVVIEHKGRRYAVVRCAYDECSFYVDNCCRPLLGCHAPEWWRRIHTNHEFGLRELDDSKVSITTPNCMTRRNVRQMSRKARPHARAHCHLTY